MGVSIYYRASRTTHMTRQERDGIDLITASCRTYLRERETRDGTWRRWEDFCVYDHLPTSPAIIFEGAAGLPTDNKDELWDAVQFWCGALSRIRKLLAEATWEMHVDDHDIPWDPALQQFDPMK